MMARSVAESIPAHRPARAVVESRAPLGHRDDRRATRPGGVVLVLSALMVVLLINFAGDVYATVRVQRLGPVCARSGRVVIHTGFLQSPECYDATTELVYFPREFVQSNRGD